MTNIIWENVSESEVRAEVEAVLESQGEAERIRKLLHEKDEVTQWRKQIKQRCQEIVDEKGIENVTPDMIYDQIAAVARENFPESVATEIKAKLDTFLKSQFEDQI